MDRRLSLALILAVLLGGALVLWLLPPDQPTPAPGGPAPFGHYVLAISWEPAFCEGAQGKPECRSQRAGRFDADHFALHGLWPDAQYCAVADSVVAGDKAGHWSSLPDPALNAGTRTALDRAMPGTQSGLERHEWIKHGTCTGAPADRYYTRAMDLLAAVNGSALRELFAGHIGQPVETSTIREALNDSFGKGAGARVRVACERDGKRQLITELTIELNGPVMGDTPLADLIAAAGPASAGCESGIVDPVGNQ